jgi:hypothetical protein
MGAHKEIHLVEVAVILVHLLADPALGEPPSLPHVQPWPAEVNITRPVSAPALWRLAPVNLDSASVEPLTTGGLWPSGRVSKSQFSL